MSENFFMKKILPKPIEEKIPSYSENSQSNIILSQKTSRFSLPFDVKLLETMTPKEYLGKYCRVSPRRQTLFKRIFEKYQNHHGEIDKENLSDALSDTYVSAIDSTLIEKVIRLFDLPNDAKINFSQFRGMAAFSERYFFNLYKRPDENKSQIQKEILEILDFSSLKWKFDGIRICSSLEEILRYI